MSTPIPDNNGIIKASMIGEPTTSLTLEAFHHTGIKVNGIIGAISLCETVTQSAIDSFCELKIVAKPDLCRDDLQIPELDTSASKGNDKPS